MFEKYACGVTQTSLSDAMGRGKQHGDNKIKFQKKLRQNFYFSLSWASTRDECIYWFQNIHLIIACVLRARIILANEIFVDNKQVLSIDRSWSQGR